MSNKLLMFPIIFFLLLNACAQQPAKPLKIQSLDQLPALAAEFETVVMASEAHGDDQQQHSHQWRFWRSADRVETRNLQDNNGEVWTKSADGNVAYERVFHDQKQVIEYMPGDLKAIGPEPNWLAVSTLLNQAMIAPMLADGREDILGRPAIHYQSNDPDVQLEITWLEHEQIPAMIKHTEHGRTMITRITAIYPLAQSPWLYQRSADYRYTDFADIGDKENDPFIKSILHKIKGGHSHFN